MTRRRPPHLLIAAALLHWLGAAPQAADDKANSCPDAAAQNGEYRIGPEDVLQIYVWKNEALSRTMPVRPDGMISLPLLNDVRAAGLSPSELRKVVARGLAEFMPDAEVSVIVQEIRSLKVAVLGEVAHPGRYDVKGRTTMLDVLAQAGGPTEFAARSRISVLRSQGGASRRIRFDYDRAVENGKQENFCLQAGDIVVVP